MDRRGFLGVEHLAQNERKSKVIVAAEWARLGSDSGA
jgi:hypothetical protein